VSDSLQQEAASATTTNTQTDGNLSVEINPATKIQISDCCKRITATFEQFYKSLYKVRANFLSTKEIRKTKARERERERERGGSSVIF